MAVRGGLYILSGELEDMIQSMRSSPHHRLSQSSGSWTGAATDPDLNPLLHNLYQLKDTLSGITDLCEIELCVFLTPFLDVIRSPETTGAMTGCALFSINKFISCNMIDSSSTDICGAVAQVADAVTHARFVGTDQSRDEVVLMQILQVLRTLMLAPCGSHLTNESVCEILQSCFRICFETRLSELLRKTSEHTLSDMIKLLFSRLPSFKESDTKVTVKKLKMKTSSRISASGLKNKSRAKKATLTTQDPSAAASDVDISAATTKTKPTRKDLSSSAEDIPTRHAVPSQEQEEGTGGADSGDMSCTADQCVVSAELKKSVSEPDLVERRGDNQSAAGEPAVNDNQDKQSDGVGEGEEEIERDFAMVDMAEDMESCYQSDSDKSDYSRKIRFSHDAPHDYSSTAGFIPHGLPCVREVFRFLISLTNPYDAHNFDHMMHIALSLLTVAMEVASDSIANFSTLLLLARDELCKHLYSLLNCQQSWLHLVLPSLRLAFLLLESIRSHLKLQLEAYLIRVMELMKSDSVALHVKEKCIDFVVKLFKIPGFAAELFINYDCDIYCSNLFEDLTKLLSKNAFPVSGLQTCNVLSLDALLALIDTVSTHCQSQFDSSSNHEYPEKLDIQRIKEEKKWLETGTSLFNTKPKKGIEYLQEHGFLTKPLDCKEVAHHIRLNWRLDKKMIGEYISERKNPQLLTEFLATFSFEGLRIDEALRAFLESFRLPGEAPVISYILEEFARQWHESNGCPFANNDAAFTLAYAVVMLNTDQHNPQAKRQNVPMTLADFKRNVRGVNGKKDFEPEMLTHIYDAIKSKEIVIPTEQSGPLKENYMWRQLTLRASSGSCAPYLAASDGAYNLDIFSLVWGSTVAALSFVFDKSMEEKVIVRSINGFRKCAQIAAFYGSGDVFDNLVISLCKFTTLVNISDDGPDVAPYYFGINGKAQLAAKTMFHLAHNQGDTLREGWKNIVDCLQNLYKCKLLPSCMVQVEDFVDPSGKISLMKEDARGMSRNDSSSSILSSFYSYFSGSDSQAQKGTSVEDQEALQQAKSCIVDCKPEHLITESKFLQESSLLELIKALRFASQGPEARLGEGVFEQDLAVFNLELLIQIAIQNRDRITLIWSQISQHLYELIGEAKSCTFLVQRAIVGLIHLCIRLMRNDAVASQVIQSLRILLFVDPRVMRVACKQISYGMHELVKTNAANIHSTDDWRVILALLEGSATGVRFYVTESCAEKHAASSGGSLENDVLCLDISKLGRDKERRFGVLEVRSFTRSWESVVLIVRDTAHVTPYNLQLCVHLIKAFAEASVAKRPAKKPEGSSGGSRAAAGGRRSAMPRSKTAATVRSTESLVMSDEEDTLANSAVELVSQLLNLVEELHRKASHMLHSWASEEGEGASSNVTYPLWTQCWKPLLEAIGFLCADPRREVRMDALGRLQRCLLAHDMLQLSAAQWEDCFSHVFLPVLREILQDINPNDISGVEETRMRAANTLSKVFLQRLNTLLGLPNFLDLWVDILSVLKAYMGADGGSELLSEAIPESLKNILLVMQTARLFDHQSQFTITTWTKIDEFIPSLKDELIINTPLPPPPAAATPPVLTQSSPPLPPGLPIQAQSQAPTDSSAPQSESATKSPETPESPPERAISPDRDTSGYTSGGFILQPPLPESPRRSPPRNPESPDQHRYARDSESPDQAPVIPVIVPPAVTAE